MLSASRLSPGVRSKLISELNAANQRTKVLLRPSVCSASSSATGDDYQYLHRSIVPTHHFQKSIPRLPVPKLADSCRRYLDAQRPMLDDEEFNKTSALAKEFEEGVGKDLHERLVEQDKANKHTSYISGPWFDMYLADPRPVVLNHNPGMIMTDDPNPKNMDRLTRATNLVISSLRFMRTLRAGILEPEVFHLNSAKSDTQQFRKVMRMLPESVAFYGAYFYKAFPLDMSQYFRLFNSTRIPGEERDQLWNDASARHLVVIRNGNFVAVEVLDQNGNVRPPAEVLALLARAVSLCDVTAPHSPGYLTAENRRTWAAVRNKFLAAGNEEQLRTIDSALFALCLDDESRADNDIESTRQFLHGNAANRWYDKCFQLCLDSAGVAAVNFEHSWGDGVAVLRYFNEVFKDSTEKPGVSPDTDVSPGALDIEALVRPIEFTLTPEIEADIAAARDNFEAFTARLDLDYVKYEGGGKQAFKKAKIGPDAMMQLAFQMAHHKLFGSTAATYESCSTAAFRHGRTETIRSATSATKAACEAIAAGNTSVDEMRALLQACSDKHNALTKEAAMGQGFDRHLFAMRKLSEQQGMEVPLFQDASYSRLNHIVLSTSTLVSPSCKGGAFAPVVPDGFGIAYGCYEDWMGCMTSTWEGRDCHGFVDAIKESFDQILDVMSRAQPPAQ